MKGKSPFVKKGTYPLKKKLRGKVSSTKEKTQNAQEKTPSIEKGESSRKNVASKKEFDDIGRADRRPTSHLQERKMKSRQLRVTRGNAKEKRIGGEKGRSSEGKKDSSRGTTRSKRRSHPLHSSTPAKEKKNVQQKGAKKPLAKRGE